MIYIHMCPWTYMHTQMCACTYIYTWCIYSQSHLGWHFRMLFQSSKLKARKSLFSEMWQKRRSSFELWAFENVTPSGIGCTYVSMYILLYINMCIKCKYTTPKSSSAWIATGIYTCHTSNIPTSRVTRDHELCQSVHAKFLFCTTFGWDTHINESCPKSTWVTVISTERYSTGLFYSPLHGCCIGLFYEALLKSPVKELSRVSDVCDMMTHVDMRHHSAMLERRWAHRQGHLQGHDSLMCVTWLVDVCDMTHDRTRWCVWPDSLMCVTWLVDVCIPSEWCANRKNDTRARVTHVHLRCTCMCDMTHIHLWHASRTNVTWLTYTRDMTRWYVWHDSLMCVTCDQRVL